MFGKGRFRSQKLNGKKHLATFKCHPSSGVNKNFKGRYESKIVTQLWRLGQNPRPQEAKYLVFSKTNLILRPLKLKL